MKEDYSRYTDEELLVNLRDGEPGIMDYIMNKYKNLVRSKAKSMYILGADSEDLIQEGMIGLFKAVRDYDTGRDASFSTFADLCVSRQMYTAVQASRRKKHIPSIIMCPSMAACQPIMRGRKRNWSMSWRPDLSRVRRR